MQFKGNRSTALSTYGSRIPTFPWPREIVCHPGLPFSRNFGLTWAANLQWIAQKGITLTNYRAITHPSQPNYIASVGGDTHWVIWDLFSRISDTQPTIVDLLDAKGVSWSEYQEDLPFSGFQADYKNQTNGRNAYVRKHKSVL